MSSSIKHKHVAWRDGRPRFSPGPELRAAGHRGKDLRHDDGTWFSRGECVDWSAKFVRELAKKPAAGTARVQPARPAAYTVAQMFEDFWRSPKFDPTQPDAYAPATAADYRHRASVIERDHSLIWNAPVHVLTSPDIVTMYDRLRLARGLAPARQCVVTLSAAMSWAISRGRIKAWRKKTDNPCLGLDMATVPHRIRFATRAELAALIAAADATGRPEIADMMLLAVWTGQRQADRLALAHRALLNGRRIFRQQKTGAIVAVRDVPELAARLAAAAERRAAPRATALLAARTAEERQRIDERFAHVVLDERRWVPFLASHYQHTFAEIRDAAAAGIPAEAATAARPSSAAPPEGQPRSGGAAREAWKVQPVPTVADFHDQDFRDTAVTWMALAGATIPEIIAVTGHTAESATRILKHYLARHPEMADTAIGKMLVWYDANGETEIGL